MVSDLLQASLITETAEQRVSAASIVLKHTENKCGIGKTCLKEHSITS